MTHLLGSFLQQEASQDSYCRLGFPGMFSLFKQILLFWLALTFRESFCFWVTLVTEFVILIHKCVPNHFILIIKKIKKPFILSLLFLEFIQRIKWAKFFFRKSVCEWLATKSNILAFSWILISKDTYLWSDEISQNIQFIIMQTLRSPALLCLFFLIKCSFSVLSCPLNTPFSKRIDSDLAPFSSGITK